MRRWFFIVVTVVLAGAAWKFHAASVLERAHRIWALADQASQRFDFAAAHTHLVSYLQLRPTEAEAHLLAARCARRAEFLEEFTGPDSELPELIEGHLHAAEQRGIPAAAVALERTLAGIQHGGWFESERILFERVKQRTMDAPLVLEGLIYSYLRQFHFEKALACEEALLKLEPGNVQALLWRGRMRAVLRKRSDARADYEAALKLVPEFDAARYYLAEMFLNANQVREAEEQLKVLNGRAEKNLMVRLLWARCRIALGDESLGQELLDAWLAEAPPHHPRLLDAFDAAARVALSRGQADRAESYARRALQEAPLNTYALYDLARSLNAQGRRQEAQAIEGRLEKTKEDLGTVAHLWDRLAKDPSNLQLRNDLGEAYLRVGRSGDALIWLNSIVDRDPENRPTLETLAKFHARTGNQDVAAKFRGKLADPESTHHGE
jgi:predicted Zn-dependent protease